MGLTDRLARLAADARVPVFAIAGAGTRDAVQDLRLRPELRVLDTPKAASVLIVAGTVADRHAGELARIHDALPHPRATVLWVSDGAPTDNAPDAAKLMDFKIILEHVREWNSQKKVVINCIAIDLQRSNTFMEMLAKENGGIFVDR